LHRFAAETADCDPARVEVVDALAESDPLIEQVGLTLAHELSSPTPAGRLFADTAAQLLTAHLLRRHCAFPMHAGGPGVVLRPYHLRRIREYVDAHLATSITLDDLAAVTGLSPYYFARMFKRTTRETPHAFVMRLKVERAERLLCETDWPVARVARASGFVSASHFAAAFRRRKGTTPGEFRAGRSPRVMSIRRAGSIGVNDGLQSE
jgi:AraC family transcriptional regulator